MQSERHWVAPTHNSGPLSEFYPESHSVISDLIQGRSFLT
jgi:hypothetical protein